MTELHGILYYGAAMVKRVSIQDAKVLWFHGELILHLTHMDGNIYALPKVEAERALKYCELLEKCKTYKEAQSLYEKFSADPDRPRLIPKLLDLNNELEELEQMWIDEDSTGARDYGELSGEELINYWLPKTFDLWQRADSNIYMTDQVLTLVRDFQVWTDEWMPIEVAKSLGVPDKGYGADYLNTEFLYQDLDKFKNIFEKSGFQIKVDDSSFMKLLRYV